MKKLYILAAACLTLGFTACEDVPAPYGINDKLPETPETPADENLILSADFTSTIQPFSNYTTDGSGAWVNKYSTACASGYDGSTTTPGTYYLVSPEIDLTDVEAAHVTYDYVLQFNQGDDNQQLLISDGFSENAAAENWTVLFAKHVQGGRTEEGKADYNTFYPADIDIPADFLNKKVRIALRYSCGSNSSTWEVKNLKVLKGSASSEPNPPVTGENLLQNGDFESWTGSTPDNWKSTTSASSATLSQSTDAHGGSYSVSVAGNATQNKRIAYKELTLKAGTYTMSFWAKSTTADPAQLRPGYAIVTDGKIDASNYKYDGYTNVSNTDWTQLSYSFTLTEKTVVNLLVMNPKTNDGKNVAQAILIDDFSLVTADGGIEGGEDKPDQPADTKYAWDFRAIGSQGDWTIEDKNKPDALGYVWSFDDRYGMKASAFAGGTRYATESWLVSPELDLTGMTSATLTVNHASNYFDSFEDDVLVKISADGKNWSNIYLSEYPTGWTFKEATADISAIAGKKGARIAFVYTSTSDAAGTWEIDKISIK